ncbi:MAG: AlkA N-terminal domain-containing protein [Solirubrobacteraceae bacterium]
MLDFEHCYRAAAAKDARFDGWFFTAVTTTGIYCRPSCPARTPHSKNVRFFRTAAAAQAAGFRACKRCRPDATPGSPEWDIRADLVGRSMRLIADGVVDREGVPALARRVGFTERHLHRRLVEAVGAGPLALARAQRAQTARLLLETTSLQIADVALTAGFSSVRQFNATIRDVFAATPTQLRARRHAPVGGGGDTGTGLTVRLPFRAPFDAEDIIGFLGMRAVPGVEEVFDGAYRRSLRLPNGAGVVELLPCEGHVRATFWLEDLRDLGPAINRSRQLLDLDSDPHAILERLGEDRLVGSLVRQAPGRRVVGCVDGAELAVRAVLGQQVSVAGAVTLAARLAATHGEPLSRPVGGITRLFPSTASLLSADPDTLAMPRARRHALFALLEALDGRAVVLDGGVDRDQTARALMALPGIGPWTVSYISMRALRDPDAFMASDLGVRRGLEALGEDGSPRSALLLAERWRPYRAYAVQHLWGLLADAHPQSPARMVA